MIDEHQKNIDIEPPETELDTEEEIVTVDNSKKTKKYSKAQLCDSETYKSQRDLLRALLEEDKVYTKSQVNKLIKAYRSMEVN